jgi:hypothetical protein
MSENLGLETSSVIAILDKKSRSDDLAEQMMMAQQEPPVKNYSSPAAILRRLTLLRA